MSKRTEKTELQNDEANKKEETPTQTPNEIVESENTQKTTESVKKKRKGVFALYKIENDKVARLRPTCERCGPGYFMADHGNRYTCGHCGFTRYKPTEK
jgi:small subunit ribosomal protein S27Ae